MFKICLFDLDETLVRTEDVKLLREACKNNADAKNLKALEMGLACRNDRHLYRADLLQQIRYQHPTLKLGIVSRSPRSYVETVLAWAYPGFAWDIIVAYEDVSRTKPDGEGIDRAMQNFGVTALDEVMLVGDIDVDVRAAYHCGCLAILDQSARPQRGSEHWRALGLVPDAIIDSPEELLTVLTNPKDFLPELERLLAGEAVRSSGGRFDRINHFVPKAIGGGSSAFPVYVCGRLFTQQESVQHRRRWHALTHSIVDHKEADEFPVSWIDAIRSFIRSQCLPLFGRTHLLVTAVPHRPGRRARLESLLRQLQISVANEPIKNAAIEVLSDVLAFKEGVKSQHNDHLNRDQRFENVRDHLFVQTPQAVTGKSVLVLDDVVTTGASLIYATTYLKAAGARDVRCLALAKSVGDVL